MGFDVEFGVKFKCLRPAGPGANCTCAALCPVPVEPLAKTLTVCFVVLAGAIVVSLRFLAETPRNALSTRQQSPRLIGARSRRRNSPRVSPSNPPPSCSMYRIHPNFSDSHPCRRRDTGDPGGADKPSKREPSLPRCPCPPGPGPAPRRGTQCTRSGREGKGGVLRLECLLACSLACLLACLLAAAPLRSNKDDADLLSTIPEHGRPCCSLPCHNGAPCREANATWSCLCEGTGHYGRTCNVGVSMRGVR